jgi:hypothetical protein
MAHAKHDLVLQNDAGRTHGKRLDDANILETHKVDVVHASTRQAFEASCLRHKAGASATPQKREDALTIANWSGSLGIFLNASARGPAHNS